MTDQTQEEDFDDVEDFGSLEEESGSLDVFSGLEMPEGDLEDDFEHVLVHQGKKYAVGLFWLVNDELSPASLAKRRAKMAKADYYCSRDTVVSQHGFGYLSKGHRVGMPAGAAIVADTLVGEWHAVLKADNGWWYLAVHGDALAPNGDRFFKNEEEAYAFFKDQSEKFKWPRIYAPNDWDVPNVTAELSLDRILGEQQTAALLRPVTLDALFAGRRNKFIAFIGFVIFCALIFLISLLPSMILSNLQQPPPVMAVSELNMDVAAIKAPPKPKEEKIVEEVVEVFSTLNIPRPSAVIATCGEQLSRIVRPIPGWNITEATCSKSIANVRWKRRLGSLELLLKTAGVFPKGALARFENNEFVVTSTLPDLTALSRRNSPMESKKVQLLLNNRLNHAGSLSLFYARKQQKQNNRLSLFKEEEVQDFTNDPKNLDMKFVTRVAPQTVASYFDVDGVEITDIKWSFQSGDWTYEGKVHVEQ